MPVIMACSDSASLREVSTNINPDSTLATSSLTYLALGDSYTIGESVEEDDRWPVQLVDILNAMNIPYDDPIIIARTGWRTDELSADIVSEDPGETYDMVSLLIGVNNQYQNRPLSTYESEFKDLLNTAVTLAKGNRDKVFVLSIPDYGYTPFGQPKQETISREVDDFNNINEKITQELGILYISITDISREGLRNPLLVAVDGLHPSGEQYRLWVNRIMSNEEFQKKFVNR
jgi:acyl-CoA thioesterase I